MHSTSKNISLLLTLLLLASCFGNRSVLHDKLPEDKSEIPGLPEYESTPLSLDRFYKSKGYEPIDVVNSKYWRQQNFQLAYLAWQRNCKSKKLPIEIFIICKTQKKIDGANSDAARKFFQENFQDFQGCFPRQCGLVFHSRSFGLCLRVFSLSKILKVF